jgi:SAM-dependent methyltransferase
MLAHVKHAYGSHLLDVTVLDQCPTSLYLNRWYAERFAFGVDTVCASALDYTSERSFDVICTHNFVGRFDTASLQRLFARWHALLRPGGALITTQRVRTDGDARRKRTVADARVLSERVAAAAATFTEPLGIDLRELTSAVYEYAVRQGNHSIREPRDVTDLLEAAGFAIEQCDAGDAAERKYDRPRYPFGDASYRMRLVARRR